MHFYWVYDYPTWMLFAGLILLFVVASVTSIFTLRPWTDRKLDVTGDDNGTVSEYLGVTGIFFGLVLGMVAVGAWESYKTAENSATTEATSLAALYRSIALIPDERNMQAKAEIRRYAHTVINVEWPKQQKGIAPTDGDAVMTSLGQAIYALPTETPKQEIEVGQAVSLYFDLVTARRQRIQSVASSELPSALWWVVIASTGILISLSMLMHLPNRKLDITINVLMSILTGSILSFIIAMDNPYRGEISVSSEPYQLIVDRLMTAQGSGK